MSKSTLQPRLTLVKTLALSLLLFVVLCAPAWAASGKFGGYTENGTTKDEATWTLNGTALTISGGRFTGSQFDSVVSGHKENITSVTFKNTKLAGEYSGGSTIGFVGWTSLRTANLSGLDTLSLGRLIAFSFTGCTSLTTVTLGGKFDTSQVTTMRQTFQQCTSLKSTDFLKNLDTSSVKDMRAMFGFCSSLETLDLSGFDTSNVTDMPYMFFHCDNLKLLNLSGWKTSKLDMVEFMFGYCENLKTILVGDGWDTSKVTGSSGMFNSDYALTGENGTKYAWNNPDLEYARIDDPDNGKPGYLSRKPSNPTCEHTWDHEEYEEDEPGWHTRTCTKCGYVDTHAIDSDGSYSIVGTLDTCRVPCCRKCKQAVEATDLEDMENCCHRIACEQNGGYNTHRMYCSRCMYVFSENAPCFQSDEWEGLYSDVPMDEDIMAEICGKLLRLQSDGTAILTCACGNTAHVGQDGKYVDGPHQGEDANLLPGGYWVDFENHTTQHVDYGEEYTAFVAAVSKIVKAEVGKEDKELLKGLINGSWGNGMATKEQVKAAAEKEGAAGDVSGAEVRTGGVTAKSDLKEYSETSETGGGKKKTAKYNLSLGYKLKVTLNGKSFYMDGNKDVNVGHPTAISVRVPDNFGNKGDAVRIDHEHEGKTYTYYGKICEFEHNGVKVKTVSWTSENGFSTFTLTVSDAVTEEYRKYLQEKLNNNRESILTPDETSPSPEERDSGGSPHSGCNAGLGGGLAVLALAVFAALRDRR